MFSKANTRPRAFWLWLAVFIIVILVAAPEARGQQSPAFVNGNGAAAAATSPSGIDLLVGRSTVLNLGAPIARVSLTVPDIADALVTAPQQILIHGKAPGTISLFVWEKTGAIRTFEVTVRRDLNGLGEQLQTLFPGERIAASGSGKDVVLSGSVKSQYVIDKAAEVATGYVEKKDNVVNLLKLQEGIASNQVMLRVRFAEVSRSALQELGASWFTGANGFHDYVSRMTTQQFAAPDLKGTRSSIQGVDKWGGGRDTVDATGGETTFSDFLNFFLFNNKYSIGTVIKALQGKGVFQSLAEPNLVATDGKEASFLAGGEYPYPVVQASSGGNSISIQFKEFGVRLTFTPQIMGSDLVHLKLRPEVSALDFTNAVVISGFRVPALVTRRTETEIELRDGQTFAVAGLLNNTATSQMRKVPGIGDIPILGLLFKSRAYQKDSTELVVMITPVILRRGSNGVSEGLPNLIEPYMGKPPQTIPPPPPYTGSPRYGAPQPKGQPRTENQPQEPAQPVAQPIAPRPAAQDASSAVITDPPKAASPKPSTSKGMVREQAPAPARQATAVAPPSAPTKLSRADEQRIEEARREEQKQRELDARKQAEVDRRAAEAQREADKVAKKKAEEDQKRQAAEAKVALQKAQEEQKKVEAGAREQAKRDIEASRKAEQDRAKAEAERKKAEEQKARLAAEEAKRQQAIAAAEAKVKSAQAAYEAVVRSAEADPKKPIKPPQQP